MYDEVKKYLAAVDAAEGRAEAMPETDYYAADGTHDKKGCPECFLTAAYRDAWPLLAESADPLVRWIADNASGYKEDATLILRALPASVDVLDQIAERENWCGIWNRLLDAAEAAGVLPVEIMAEASER
jgi:hypothetical protein